MCRWDNAGSCDCVPLPLVRGAQPRCERSEVLLPSEADDIAESVRIAGWTYVWTLWTVTHAPAKHIPLAISLLPIRQLLTAQSTRF